MARRPLEIGEWGTIRRITTQHGPAARANMRNNAGILINVQRRGKTPAQAEENLKKTLAELAETTLGNNTITRDSTIAELAEIYFNELAFDKRKDGTRTTYLSIYERHLKDNLGNITLRQLTVGRLDQVIRALADRPSTAKGARVVLMNMLDVAVRHDAVRINPARNTKPVQVPKKKVQALNPDQVKDMLKMFYLAHTIDGKDVYDEILLLSVTGVRTGELLALEWEDLEKNVLHVNGTIVTDAETGKLKRQEVGKSLAATRGLTLPPTVSERLKERYKLSEGAIMFPSRSGTFQWQNNFRRRWRSIIEDTSFEGVTPRDFRKAVATYLDKRVGREGARDQLGHESEDVTTQYYIEQEEKVTDFSAYLEELISK